MNDIYKMTDIVKKVLENSDAARNSDDCLYVKVCEYINPSAIGKPFWYVLLNKNEFHLPPYESVTRVRRKLQTEFPELLGDAVVLSGRVANEQEFREWART